MGGGRGTRISSFSVMIIPDRNDPYLMISKDLFAFLKNITYFA
jgi:hypothetical protein